MNDKPLCAIWVVTYNHKKFIAQTIGSIVSQKTNFKIKIFIGDDFSTDGTREICTRFKNEYPDLIELIFNTVNYMQQNSANVFNACFNSGAKYMAMCEGDDYWTDENKLQKQVDFLEANPDHILAFHKIKILENGKLVEDNITKVPENYELIDTLASLGNYIHTPSVVFRNVIKEFPEEFFKSSIGDYFLYMLLAQYGKIMYLEDEMAVYRKNSGIWSSMNEFQMHYKTAIAHALLYHYFKKQANEKIAQIFFTRVVHFINRFFSDLSPEQLKKISTEIGSRNIYIPFMVKNILKPKRFFKIAKAAL